MNPRAGPLAGVRRLLGFDAGGLEEFGDGVQDFYNSLAPLLAFPVASALLGLLGGRIGDGLTGLAGGIVAVLAPAVISAALARIWGREAAWLRYAVAHDWCQAAMTLIMLIAAPLAVALAVAGAATGVLALGAIAALFVYWLVLSGFIAMRGLSLSAGRAALLVAAVNLGTGVLVLAPQLLAARL